MNISIKIIDNGSEYIANCPELDINCYGSDRDEAVRRIKDVIHFYISSAKEMGIDVISPNELSLEGSRSFLPSFSQPEAKNTIN